MIDIMRDEGGRLRVATTRLPTLFVDFLETDVRGNVGWCDELLTGLERAAAGQTFAISGNLYDLIATASGVEIVNAYGEATPPLKLSLAECREALRAWRRAILAPDGRLADPGTGEQ